MIDSEYDRIRAELEAEAAKIAEGFQFGKVDRSAVLDQAREAYEAIIGQPCIARYDGDQIVIQSPVIRKEQL